MNEHQGDVLETRTTADFIANKLKDAATGDAYFQAYLRAGFLESAVNSLYQARQQAGLTQAEIAEKLHTKQSAIARLENDVDGAMSLRRFVDFMMACGMIPYNITFVPMETVHDYVLEDPQSLLTQEQYHNWLLTKNMQSMFNSSIPNTTSQQHTIKAITTTQASFTGKIDVERVSSEELVKEQQVSKERPAA